MKNFFLVLCLSSLVLALPASSETPQLQVARLADGVYAILQPFEARFNDANSFIVVLGDDVLVVDTQYTPSSARAVLAKVHKLTDKPIRWVVNSHWHGDHAHGNQVYRDAFHGVQFIAHRNTREDMEKRATPELREEVENGPQQIADAGKRLAAGVGHDGKPMTDEQKARLAKRIDVARQQLAKFRQTEIVLPGLTFEDSLTLHDAGREVRILHFTGHTRVVVVVYLLAEKILFTGDLLDDLPYTGHCSPLALVATLKALNQLDFDVIVPGHGGVKQGREHLLLVLAVFESLVEQVKAATCQGLSLEETKKNVDLERHREPLTRGQTNAVNAWNSFIPTAIERAWQEATGKGTP